MDWNPEAPVLGVMSGSSRDGLDICAVRFFPGEEGEGAEFEVLAARSYPLDETWKKELLTADSLPGESLCALDMGYGRYIGAQIRRFCEECQVSPLVCAIHGHTVFHTPGSGVSKQLGHGAAIAEATGIPTVTDLRSADVMAGGQGAPFAPLADRDLFPGYAYYLNLGGIVNMTSIRDAGIFAADIGPCNQLLDGLASERGLAFDEDGQLARSGSRNDAFWEQLESLAPPVKPTASAIHNQLITGVLLPAARQASIPLEDKLHTTCDWVADRIRRWITMHEAASVTLEGDIHRIYVTGGGVHNAFLLERITEAIDQLGMRTVVPETQIVDHKESILIAWMGWLRLMNRPNALPSVTGAARPTVGGALYPAL